MLVGLHQWAEPKLSPEDELQHVDYLDRAGRGGIVRTGDTLDTYARIVASCRGIESYDAARLPACEQAAAAAPDRYPESGVNTIEIHPPLYYFVTAPLARLAQAIGVAPSFVTAARLVGGLWLWAGLCALWALARHLRAPAAARLGVCAMVAASPAVVYASSHVGTDAPALLAGAGIVLLAVRWEDGRAPTWLLAAAATAVMLIKAPNLLGIGVAIGYLLLRALKRPRLLVGAAALFIGFAIGQVGWLAARSALAFAPPEANPITVRFHVDSLTVDHWASQLVTFLPTPAVHAHRAAALENPFVDLGLQASSIVLTGALVGVLLLARRPVEKDGDGDRLVALAPPTLLVLVLGPPVLVLGTFIGQGTWVPIPARYGLPLLPLLAAVAAAVATTRAASAALLAVGGFVSVATLIQLWIG